MKIAFFLISLFFVSLSSFSQNFTVVQGNEFKMQNKFSNPQLIGSDETGVYFTTYREKRKYAQADVSDKIYSLLKYDKNLNSLFDYEYEKDLEGSEVYAVKQLKNRLFLFSILTPKKEDSFTLLCSELDKATGKITGPLKELGTYSKKKKRSLYDRLNDYYNIQIKLNYDSTNIITIVGSADEDLLVSDIRMFDFNLKQTFKVNYVYGKKGSLVYIEDVFFASDNTAIVVTGENEISEAGRKGRTGSFKGYSITSINNTGKVVFTTTCAMEGKYFITGKAADLQKDQIIIACLYSNIAGSKKPTGTFLNKYDLLTGKLISSSTKDIAPEILSRLEAEKKFDVTKDDLMYGILKGFKISSININPLTKAPVIVAEFLEFFSEHRQSIVNGKLEITEVNTSFCSDLIMIESDQSGIISRISGLPKMQKEGFFAPLSSSFTSYTYSPFTYASFASFIWNNKFILFVNDHAANSKVLKAGDAIKPATDMSESAAYALIFDFSTGTFSRKFLFSNSGQPIAVLKNGMLFGNEFITYGRISHIAGKMEYKLVKVIIK